MEIKIAKICGLCAGCKNAINQSLQTLKQNKNVTLFKEIVHNDTVNKLLLQNGAKIKDQLKDLSTNEMVILRAHGEKPETYTYLHKNKIRYIDCTCVLVKKVHEIISKQSAEGYKIILIGKKGHPEVIGSVGYARNNFEIIENEEDILKLNFNKNDKICVVYQTTFNEYNGKLLYGKIKAKCEENGAEIINKNTLCPVQKQINLSSISLAQNCDFMIVVGNANSSNTKELFNNLKSVKQTIFIENIYNFKEIFSKNNIILTKKTKIGITAGASTQREELYKLKQFIIDFYNKIK